MEKVLPTGEALIEASNLRIKKREEELTKLKKTLTESLDSRLSTIEKDISLEKDRNRANKLRLEVVLAEMELEVKFHRVNGQIEIKEVNSTKQSFFSKLKGE